MYAASIFYGQVKKQFENGLYKETCVYIYIHVKAKPTDEEIIKLSEILNVPTQHLMEEMGAHFFPSRGGYCM